MQLRSAKKRIAVILVCGIVVGGTYFHSEIAAALIRGPFAATVILISPSASTALEIGNHYFNVDKEGHYNLSLAAFYFKVALFLDPKVPDAWHQLARIDFLRGDFAEALQKINTQIDLHGESLMSSYYIRGLIHGFRKEYISAEADFLRFLTWNGESWAAHNDLAWIYFEQGKFAEAEAVSREGLVKNPLNAWLLVMHGMSTYNLGDTKTAREDLMKARVATERLTTEDWQQSYPGNDPRVASVGLESLKKAIEDNLALVEK